MDNKAAETVTQFDQDKIVSIMERQVKRWMIAFLIAFIALIGTNIGWVIYESQFEDVVTTVSQESSSDGGGDAIINGTYAGAVLNGTSETNDYEENTTEEDGR